ncbi:hypothetical protein SMICM17S_01728 [Streptomyces microflavus]
MHCPRPAVTRFSLWTWATGRTPRAKVYVRHDEPRRSEAGRARCAVSTRSRRPAADRGASSGRSRASAPTYWTRTPRRRAAWRRGSHRRPVLTCHAFTDKERDGRCGFTLHIPVRDYVRHDGEAVARAGRCVGRTAWTTAALLRAPSAVTSRRLEDGVGLIAYLALAHQRGRPPRVTAYVSAEAYEVRPAARLPAGPGRDRRGGRERTPGDGAPSRRTAPSATARGRPVVVPPPGRPGGAAKRPAPWRSRPYGEPASGQGLLSARHTSRSSSR